MSDDVYEAFAVRYAEGDRNGAEVFIGGDPHDQPIPISYYIWILCNSSRTIVVDTGFDEVSARKRKRKISRPVAEGLEALGIDRNAVTDVIISHMHYDHAGNDGLFPNACFHLQDSEMAFATGRCMCHRALNLPYDAEDVVNMVRRVYAGSVRFHDGDTELFPGITLHHMGGHSRGLQSVRVKTKRGNVIIASDVAHFYAHLEDRRVFPYLDSVSDALEGYESVKRLADSFDHIIPGHDPLVSVRYPALSPLTKDWIVRLDHAPGTP
ncbi:N-acyl homoserine lactonase family protein [Paracoccus sp. SCSIO 75233]|uniref:N-acyl homoserine lactonase family protein n=1 Tax=Paracoccus sp. SCSIO 75233 TaxID=3017782 RepID=UPI0022F02880|nr:N-acyl homoserine lactonase family protein [Paracoccus sp. SCSIO 75233]WBU52399.1 N-acyl homoserine lactonase family protein [Paracoccus sp. SCSIO 75233]